MRRSLVAFLGPWVHENRFAVRREELLERTRLDPLELDAIGEVLETLGLLRWNEERTILEVQALGCVWGLRNLYHIASSEATLLGSWDDNGQGLPSHEASAWMDQRRHALSLSELGDPARVQRVVMAAFVGQRSGRRYVLVDDASDTWKVPTLIGGKHEWKRADDGRLHWETVETALAREVAEELGSSWKEAVDLELEPSFFLTFRKWSGRLRIYTEYQVSLFLPANVRSGSALRASSERRGHIGWMPLDGIGTSKPYFEEVFTEDVRKRLAVMSAVYEIPESSPIPLLS